MYTHRSTYLHTFGQAMTDSMGLSATDSICGIVPMFHAMGWGLPFTATMLGAKQVMPHRFMQPEHLLDLLAGEEVTMSAGVPTIWQGVRAAIEAEPERWDLAKLERITCGGSAPPVSMMRWYWDELGIEVIQGWGMTETNPLGTVSRKQAKRAHLELSDDEQFENVAKAGLLLPGLEMEIVDDNFKPLPHDGEAVGELVIRGPWICAEYYNDPQPDKFRDGWLVTGDVAKIDAEQYLTIADRSKDLIKSGGEWISSVDLENHIVGLPGVAQAAVVAQPHPRWDERPVALVVRAAGSEVPAEEIRAHCAEAFAKWQLPDEVLFVDEIPFTSTGKIDKKAIRADLLAKAYQLPDQRG
jgi:fatty-acyl-CoA synthase